MSCTTCHFDPCQCFSEVVQTPKKTPSRPSATITCKKCGTPYTVETVSASITYSCTKCKVPLVSPSSSTVATNLPPNVQAAAAKPENVVGRYICVDSLGRGGMGVVFRAYDTELRRWVAIKFMTAIDDEDLKRFRREALVMAKLQHANIAQIYEVGEHTGRHYIVMQLIEGRSLPRAELPKLDVILEKFESVCRAVDYAHQQGIIHRDLKPDNIMIDKRGQMYVLDFGLARAQDVRTTMSKSGTAIGTPAYMAPEQASGKSGEIDSLSDVYGLGATLYWIATGKIPFVSEDVYETLMKVVNVDPMAPRKVNPDLPPDVETIIQKAMSKEKQRRYATAAALADDLQRYRTGEAIQARPASMVYKIQKKITKNPLLSGALAVAVIALFLVAGLWLQRASSGRSYAKQGMQFYSTGDYKKAKECFDQAMALGVSDPLVLKRRQECEKKLQEVSKSAADKELDDKVRPILDRAREHLEAARILRYQPKWDAPRFQAELSQAKEGCDRALREAPSYGPALSIRGQAFAEEGDYERAVADLERAKDPAAGRAYLLWMLADAYQGKPTEMQRRKAEELLPGEEPEGLYARGRYAELLEKAAASGMGKEMNPLLRGVVLIEQGKPHKAMEPLQQAAAIAPSSRLPWLYLAKALVQAEYFSDGPAAAEKITELDPTNAYAHLYRGMLRAGVNEPEPALVDFTKAIQLNAGLAEAHRQRGLAHYTLKRLDEAVKDFDRALQFKTDWAQVHYERALAKYERGDGPGGDADWATATRLDPKLDDTKRGEIERARESIAGENHPRTWYRRGEQLWAQKQALPALEAYSKSIELDPKNPQAFFARGIVYEHLGDLRKAIKDYDRALALKPDHAHALLNRSAVRYMLEDYEGSIKDCDRLLKINPNSNGAYNNRSSAKASLGDIRGAIEDADKALQLKPDDASALGNRGKYKGQLGDLQGSLDDLTKSLQKDPEYPRTYMDRGVTYANLGKIDEAIKDFTRAIELDPKYVTAYRNRAIAYYHKKRFSEALRDIDKVVELDPSAEPSLRSLREDIKSQMN